MGRQFLVTFLCSVAALVLIAAACLVEFAGPPSPPPAGSSADRREAPETTHLETSDLKSADAFRIKIPDGWWIYPDPILRAREELASESLNDGKGGIQYDYGFQESQSDPIDTPPYAYVVSHKYADFGLSSKPSRSQIAEIAGEYGAYVTEGKKKLQQYFDENDASEISDYLRQVLNSPGTQFDADNMRIWVSADYQDPVRNMGLAYISMTQFGNDRSVRIDFFVPTASLIENLPTIEAVSSSLRFAPGFEY